MKGVTTTPNELNICPVCHCNDFEYINAVGGEYVGLIITGHGSVSPRVCINCGAISISGTECARIQKLNKNRRFNNA